MLEYHLWILPTRDIISDRDSTLSYNNQLLYGDWLFDLFDSKTWVCLNFNWPDQLQASDLSIDKKSLIGFCWNNDLAWANPRFKEHPPSSSHWQFYHSVVRPRIAATCDLKDVCQKMLPKIKSMDIMWQES